jgi:hypothetical protein
MRIYCPTHLIERKIRIMGRNYCFASLYWLVAIIHIVIKVVDVFFTQICSENKSTTL